MTYNYKQHRCVECGNIQPQKSYCLACCGTSLLPLADKDNTIKTHEQYMDARCRLDELTGIAEPTSEEKIEKRWLDVNIWLYELRKARNGR